MYLNMWNLYVQRLYIYFYGLIYVCLSVCSHVRVYEPFCEVCGFTTCKSKVILCLWCWYVSMFTKY